MKQKKDNSVRQRSRVRLQQNIVSLCCLLCVVFAVGWIIHSAGSRREFFTFSDHSSSQAKSDSSKTDSSSLNGNDSSKPQTDSSSVQSSSLPEQPQLPEGAHPYSVARDTEDELADKAGKALDEMLSFGTTTVEAKSGYGLSTAEELKQLRVIRRLSESSRLDIMSTFMGAHALPPEYKDRRDDYVNLICDEMIPAVAEKQLAAFCDVFCETGVFTAEEAGRILETGRRYGLIPKIHADEIDPIGGSQLAGALGAISAEHLIVCPDAGIEALARGGTVACLLPATSFYLNSTYAPARKMIDAGVPVAMASDFNPGSCPCLNLQLVMNLGCLKYRMTPEEVLTAVTLNGAAAIACADRLGSLDAGKQADLVIWDAPDLNYLCYRLGSNLTHTVIKKGEIVHAPSH